MEIGGCRFPDDRLYDREGFVWVDPPSDSGFRLGITTILAGLAGRLTRIDSKPLRVEYQAGRIVGTIEGGKYFGPIRTPLTATLVEINEEVIRRPKTLSEDPYGLGWFARLETRESPEAMSMVLSARDAAPILTAQLAALRVRCFAAFPDHEMFEIGTECSAVLSKLDDLLATIPLGDVVHLVSDDSTAPIEMARWSEGTGHPVVDSRREGDLYHFLVRKASRPSREY